MLDKVYVGLDLTGFENNGIQRPVSRVTLMLDDQHEITAGDDSGMELKSDCPHATQAMVNAILAELQGSKYQMYGASNAKFDPSAELGDGITANGVYSVISRLDDDGMGFPSPSAPGKAELEDEYPSGGPMTEAFDRQFTSIRSSITKTAEEIRLKVEDIDGRVSSITTQIDSITLSVENGSTSSTIKLMIGDIEISSQNIAMNGLVTFQGLENGTTTIDGSCIKTGTIESVGISSVDISGSSISGSSFYSESDTSSMFISGGKIQLKNENILAGYVRTNKWKQDTTKKGISFALASSGGFMSWSRIESDNQESETSQNIVKLFYAGKELANQYGQNFQADTLYLSCNVHSLYDIDFGPSTKIGSRLGVIHYGSNTFQVAADNGNYFYLGNNNSKEIILEESINKLVVCHNDLDMRNNSILNTSDERLKTNIEESDVDALSVINSIKTYNFDWVENSNHENLGFIAQQLEAEVSADFVSINGRDGHYSTREFKMIPYLVKAVQQLSKAVQELRGNGSVARFSSRRKQWTPTAYSEAEKLAYAESLKPEPIQDISKDHPQIVIPEN